MFDERVDRGFASAAAPFFLRGDVRVPTAGEMGDNDGDDGGDDDSAYFASVYKPLNIDDDVSTFFLRGEVRRAATAVLAFSFFTAVLAAARLCRVLPPSAGFFFRTGPPSAAT